MTKKKVLAKMENKWEENVKRSCSRSKDET